MKKILGLIASVALLLPLAGCEKEMMSYQGERGVYFAVQRGHSYSNDKSWPFFPDTPMQFVMYTGQQETVSLLIRATGDVADYPRTFLYEIDPELTTAVEGVDYVKPSGEGVIPAGSSDGRLNIVVNRTEKMKTETVDIGLRLVANENFALAFTEFDQPYGMNASSEPITEHFDNTRHVVKINDILVQPPVWLGGIYQYGQFEEFNVLGVFGPKKFNLICEITGVTYSDFMSSATMPTGYMSVIGRRVAAYLKEQYRNHTPVLEDDGRLMWVDGCGWTSYPGVAWDGTYDPEYYY